MRSNKGHPSHVMKKAPTEKHTFEKEITIYETGSSKKPVHISTTTTVPFSEDRNVTTNVAIEFIEGHRPGSSHDTPLARRLGLPIQRDQNTQTGEAGSNDARATSPVLKFSPRALKELSDLSVIESAYCQVSGRRHYDDASPPHTADLLHLSPRRKDDGTLSEGSFSEALFTMPTTLRQYTEKEQREREKRANKSTKKGKRRNEWSLCSDFLAWEVETTEKRLRKVGYDFPEYNDEEMRKKFVEKHVRSKSK